MRWAAPCRPSAGTSRGHSPAVLYELSTPVDIPDLLHTTQDGMCQWLWATCCKHHAAKPVPNFIHGTPAVVSFTERCVNAVDRHAHGAVLHNIAAACHVPHARFKRGVQIWTLRHLMSDVMAAHRIDMTALREPLSALSN